MKICFYLENKSCEGVDFSNPLKGNPGIGGTQFMIWSLSYYLSNLYKEDEIIVLANIIDTLPKNTINLPCNSIHDAIKKSRQLNSDIFVFRGPICDKSVYDLINKLELNSIMWSHNFEDSSSIKLANDCKYIKRNICVGREQYNRLRDHDILQKSHYIYNGLDFSIYNTTKNIKEKENIVCYIGSIIPSKGFHLLAEAWSDIEHEVEDAKLYVIGGGNLYDKNASLGKFGIADESYETKFIKHLVDGNGEIKKNVRFLGVTGGLEKIKTMENVKVGVTNPTGKTETFGIGAVEFQALGIPVVAKKKDGFLDTVVDGKTGILINSKKQLSSAIIKLLKNSELNKELGENGHQFVVEKFNIEKICREWKRVFECVASDKTSFINIDMINPYNNFKLLREANRTVKKVKLLNKMPSIIDYEDTIKFSIKTIIKKVKK